MLACLLVSLFFFVSLLASLLDCLLACCLALACMFRFNEYGPESSILLGDEATAGQRFFLESRIYTKREQHHVRVGNLAGGRRRAEASRRHFAHILARRHLMELLCIV